MKIHISDFYKKHLRVIPGVKSYILVSLFVFLIGAGITLLSWHVDRQRINSQRENITEEQADSVKAGIQNQMEINEQILRGTSGLFGATGSVTRDEWKNFVSQYILSSENNVYPGLTTVGYLTVVPKSNVEAFNNSLRAEGIFQPDIQIFPAKDKAEYLPVTFIEPFTDETKKSVGLDALESPERVKLANSARDTGQVKLSNKLTTTILPRNSLSSDFVMFLALYKDNVIPRSVAERRQQVYGYVFAGAQGEVFFKSALEKTKFKAYPAVEIYDGMNIDENNLLYRSANFQQYNNGEKSNSYSMRILDRPWTFRFAGPLAVNQQDKQRSDMILIGGITMSAAVAGFIFLVMLTRARAIVYSKQFETQQAKDDLLSLASHQLRTPATAVKQYLGIILEGYTGKVSKKQLPALEKAYLSNERQLDTINKILYVAKADAGRLSINKTNFDLNLLIDDIVSDLEDSFEEKSQSIQIDRSRKKLKINADESSIRMVIENLLSNASKYSFEDSVIKIKTSLKNDIITITITDAGVGISKNDFEKLFKKFSRIDNELSVQVGGSGIGLYIDKVLVELHGGTIDVESEEGKGTIFTIKLPRNSANNLTDGGKSISPI